MCLGPEILLPMVIGTALSAGGKMIQQGEEQKQAEDRAAARNAVLADTLFRNDQIAQGTRDTFTANQRNFDPSAVAQRQADAEAKRAATGESVLAVPGEAVPTSADAPDIVKRETAKRVNEAIDKVRGEVRAKAKLGAFGDQWFRAGLGTDQASRDVAMQSGFAGQNLALMPHLQDFAELRSYKPISPIGGIMMGVGNALGGAAGSGFFSPRAG